MKQLLFILLLLTNLYSKTDSAIENPVVYAALGDTIYNNVDKINELQYLPEYQVYLDDIATYVKNVHEAKAMGYKIEEGDKTVSQSDYLKRLRKLSKTNDFFVHNIKNNFKYALKHSDNKLFVSSIDSGLVNIGRYYQDIKKYYKKHENEIDEYGDILGKLIATYTPKVVKEKAFRGPTKKEVQAAKMRRIRQKDRQKQEAMQRALEEELIKKKVQIRKIQKEEIEATSK